MGAVQDSYITVAWLVLLVVLLVIEIITVGLTTIWGAGGALAALILNILDVPFAGQVVAIFYCDNFTACIYKTICNAFYQHPPSEDEL